MYAAMQLGVHAVHLSCVISRLFHWFRYRFCFDLTEKKKTKKKKKKKKKHCSALSDWHVDS